MPRAPAVAETTATLSDTVFSELVRRARALGRPVHGLHVGDTWLEPLPAARAEAQRAGDVPRLHNYAPVQGEPVLLDAIVERLEARVGRSVDRELVQVTPGATAGLSAVAATLLAPGDEVLVPSPYWPLIRGILASRGAVPVEVPLHHRLDDPTFDAADALERAIGPRTVALYVNTPNNPTGALWDPALVERVAALAARHDLWVITDEAYEELWFDGPRPAPVWDHPALRDRAVACHTLSKSHGLAGARIGFVHGPPGVMPALRGVQTFLTYCAARPLQRGAAAALREGDGWVAEARALYAAAGRRTAEALGVRPPAGGTFLLLDCRPHLREGERGADFLHRCLEGGVLLTPGAACGRDFGDWARVCFTSLPPDELDRALEALRRVLDDR